MNADTGIFIPCVICGPSVHTRSLAMDFSTIVILMLVSFILGMFDGHFAGAPVRPGRVMARPIFGGPT